MSVVGIDFGTLSSFIGVARAGGIETIANEYSDRCTPSYVSLGAKERAFGASAKQQAVTNFKNTVCGFKRALARKYNDPFVQREISRSFRPNTVAEASNGDAIFKLSYQGEPKEISPAQLTGMLLNKLKFTAESGLQTKVNDVVVSVPAFYTDVERRALYDACQLAGLNCLRILNDTTAVALAYGIYKSDLPAETEKPRNVVFVDFGYTSVQVSACAFHKGKLKVLATSFAPDVGGRDFDELIVNHMAAEFKKKYKIDAFSRPKTYIRLTQECEKLKKLMSANVQAIPLNIECFMDDIDVHASMSRTQFEELAAPLLTKIHDTLRAVLDNAKLKPADTHSVEIVGGSSRIPAFKQLVEKVFSKEPSTTLNADEAVARGCTLQCAILSPTFRVRDFSITDCQPFSVTLSWQPQTQMEEDCNLEVFTRFHPAPFSKMLTFFRKEPFVLTAAYTSAKDVPFPHTEIGSFKVNNVVPQANGDSSKVKVKVRVNSHGIFTVMSASMYEKIEGQAEQEEEVKENMDVDGEDTKKKDNNSGDGSSPAEEGTNAMDQSGNTEQSMEEGNEQQQNTDKQSNDTAEAAPSQDGGEKKNTKKSKKTTKTIDLPIEASVCQMSQSQLNSFIEIENQMVMQDRLEKERANAKNAVEEYVYDMRDKLYSMFEEFVKEEERTAFTSKLEATENWLYEDGEDETKQVYVDKLAELKKIGQPIADRHRESKEWPVVCDEMGASIQQIRKFLHLWGEKDEKYNHIEKADVDKIEKLLTEKANWYNQRLNQMSQIKKHENPVVLAHQVRHEKKILETTCHPIMNKPKPKVEPPKEEKVEEKTEKENGSQATNGDQPNQQQADESQKGTEQMDVD